MKIRIIRVRESVSETSVSKGSDSGEKIEKDTQYRPTISPNTQSQFASSSSKSSKFFTPTTKIICFSSIFFIILIIFIIFFKKDKQKRKNKTSKHYMKK